MSRPKRYPLIATEKSHSARLRHPGGHKVINVYLLKKHHIFLKLNITFVVHRASTINKRRVQHGGGRGGAPCHRVSAFVGGQVVWSGCTRSRSCVACSHPS